VAASVVGGACSRSSKATGAVAPTTVAPTAATAAANPCSVPLQATDVGITPSDITIEVMADVGSPLFPGLFKGAVDAVNAFAARVNAHGGLACRQLKVRTWDSKLDATESKNGQIDACQNAFAMVGTSAGFNLDFSTLATCADAAGKPTGLPDVSGFSGEDSQCGVPVFTVIPIAQACPVPPGDNTYSELVGDVKWELAHNPGLHGLFLIAGGYPALTNALVPLFTAYQQAGVVWDGIPKVSNGDTQTDYIPRVQIARTKASSFVYNGGADTSMIFMRKEAAAQGETSVKVWACPYGCYTPRFIAQGGAAVDGTYVTLDYLPFEEARYNADEMAYVNGVGGASNADTFGVFSWAAADAFQDAVNTVVTRDGPNGLTRAKLIGALRGLTHVDAHGWVGAKSLAGPPSTTPCFVLMQVQNGKFVRVYPATPGTMDCNPSNLATVTVDAAAVAATLK
jgi:hypothetical protein